MTTVRAKAPRVVLDPESYRQLHRRILERDNWRCQFCGTMQNLQVHHLHFRSRAGDDKEENLIALCDQCHSRLHGLNRAQLPPQPK